MLRSSLFLAVCSAAPLRQWADLTFEQYASDFTKTYPHDSERVLRKGIFEEKLQQIAEHNEGYAAGKFTWYAAVNEFTDLTSEEFAQLKKSRVAGDGQRGGEAPKFASPLGDNPSRVDWRERGVVTDVKDQSSCGSCWAFAATEALESHHAIANGELLELAPQTFVSCAPNDNHCGGTGGCEGSIPELAFNFTASSGIALEKDMPYTGQDDACVSFPAAVTCDSYVQLPANSAEALETAVATQGPVAVNVATTGWQTYGGGLFSGGCDWPLSPLAQCTLDHVVVVVGYDTSGDGYWLVRNSWGKGSQKVPAWGEDGYIRLSRKSDAKVYTDSRPQDGVACEPFPAAQQVGGECGLLFDASYPSGVRRASGFVV